jgi:hypothetical protein
LLVLTAAWFVPSLAYAQAPPPAFFEGRSTADLRALALDPHNDVLLRRSAATKLVMTLADEGDLDAADAMGRAFAKNIDPAAIKYAQAVRRRSHVHVVALGLLGVALAIALSSLALAHRLLTGAFESVRSIAPVFAFFLINVGLLGAYLASSYENSSGLPFVLFAALMLPLLILFRAWSAVGSGHVTARLGRGALAAVATIALGFLVVEHVNPAYLEAFGL